MLNHLSQNSSAIHNAIRPSTFRGGFYFPAKIKHFSCSEWALKTCEVRVDTGKFVNSTWELTVDGAAYWLTIGFGNVAETIIRKDSSGKTGITESGELYVFVEKVNASLMAQGLDGSK